MRIQTQQIEFLAFVTATVTTVEEAKELFSVVVAAVDTEGENNVSTFQLLPFSTRKITREWRHLYTAAQSFGKKMTFWFRLRKKISGGGCIN